MGRRSGRYRGGLVALLILACIQCGRSDLPPADVADAGSAGPASTDAGGSATGHLAEGDADAADAGASDADAGNAGVDAGGNADSGDSAVTRAPRPIAPLSTATVTSHTPLLRWSLPAGADGVEIDICRDRQCTTRVATFQASGSSVVSPTTLTQGVYFWRLRGMANGSVGTVNGPVWEFFVGTRSAAQNTSWGSTLDANGDGYADVMIGAPGVSGVTENAYLYFGGRDGLSSAPTTLSYTNHPNGYHREPIASAGDVDGDGFPEVVIGAPDLPGKTGGVLVFSGGALGIATTPIQLPAPEGVDASFGWSVAGAGDVNGDGYADVLVGASQTNTNQGAAFLYYGGPHGLSTPPTTISSTGLPAGLYAYFGNAVIGAGDINGDGFADIAIGAIQGKTLFVYLGGASGLSVSPQLVLEPHVPDQPDQDPGFGSTLASAGDVNGDGFADVLAGAPSDGDDYRVPGAVYLLLGSATGLVTPPIALAQPTASTDGYFGSVVAGGGDVDGDGYADLLAATVSDSYVYLGGPTGPATRPVRLTIPGGEDNMFGGALAGAGDVDGDGFADVLTGSPWSNAYVGGAFLYKGSELGVGSPFAISGPNTPNGIFGASVASIDGRLLHTL